MVTLIKPKNSNQFKFSADVYRVTTTDGYLAIKIPAGELTTVGTSQVYVYFSDAALSSFLCAVQTDTSAVHATHVVNNTPELTSIGINDEGTILLTPSAASASVTINNGNNLKKVTVGKTEYTNFPVSVTVSNSDIITGYGKDSPVITVDYLNTQEPVITDS